MDRIFRKTFPPFYWIRLGTKYVCLHNSIIIVSVQLVYRSLLRLHYTNEIKLLQLPFCKVIRQSKAKGRPFAQPAAHVDRPTMRLNDMFDYG